MKSITKVSLFSFAVLAFSCGANASNYDNVTGTTCSAKKQAIETQISYAEKNNNMLSAQGLKKALSDVNSYCSNDDLEAKYKKKVEEKTEKVAERMQDLKEAQIKGDAKKIAKQEAKLQKVQAELTKAQSTLAQFYKDIKSN